MSNAVVRIPLHDRYGSICAYMSIDAADEQWVRQWDWRLASTEGSYAYRVARDAYGRRSSYALHRELMGCHAGDGKVVDHIDRDRLNNCRSNLRILPKGANAQNIPAQRGHSSQYRGVSWHKKRRKWQATVRADGRNLILGYFESEEQAAEAAREGRRKYMPYATD